MITNTFGRDWSDGAFIALMLLDWSRIGSLKHHGPASQIGIVRHQPSCGCCTHVALKGLVKLRAGREPGIHGRSGDRGSCFKQIAGSFDSLGFKKQPRRYPDDLSELPMEMERAVTGNPGKLRQRKVFGQILANVLSHLHYNAVIRMLLLLGISLRQSFKNTMNNKKKKGVPRLAAAMVFVGIRKYQLAEPLKISIELVVCPKRNPLKCKVFAGVILEHP